MEAGMKTLIVTGASKGIGFEIAQQFLEEDYRAINFSRSAAPDARIENHSIDFSFSDMEDQAKKLISIVVQTGEICLVHNAAKLSNDTADDTDTESFREIMNINVVAAHILNQLIIPLMQSGSSIIYLGSTLSEKAVANTYSYIVSKHAIVGMMRSTCQDLKGTGIHTACVCPGFTDTEMLRGHIGNDPEVAKDIAAASTFGRLIAPAEIASTVKFAAQNPVINGAVLHANLGQIEN